MLPILTHRQMSDVDSATVERCGIPTIELMENAAKAVAQLVLEIRDLEDEGLVTIFCGRGNNGGDGFALARILSEEGVPVVVIGIETDKLMDGDARTNFERLKTLPDSNRPRLIEVGDSAVGPDSEIIEIIGRSSVVVDAMFGTGLSRPIEGLYAALISLINNRAEKAARPIPCISIDIPSGLFADSALSTDCHVKADYTATFTAPKLANVMAPAKSSNGNLLVVDIGTPPDLLAEYQTNEYVTDVSDAAEWMDATAYTSDSYKTRRGHVLCVTGSVGYEGAAVLSANSAMMSGAGIVTVFTPESARVAIASRVIPEVMVRGYSDEETRQGMISEMCAKADSILVGCGVGIDDARKEMVSWLVANAKSPLIIDADALSMLNETELSRTRSMDLILTPHEGEFRRLFGTEPGLGENRIANVRTIAVEHGVVIVLKGESVVIGFPDGRIVINPTGNSALGKAGNGDNLAGIIAGFAAQSAVRGTEISGAVIAAVYVAGLAGDIAKARIGERVMTASDVRDSLSDAFQQVEAG